MIHDRGLSRGFGLEGGVDTVRYRGHRLGLYSRLETEFASTGDYSSISIGVAYQR